MNIKECVDLHLKEIEKSSSMYGGVYTTYLHVGLGSHIYSLELELNDGEAI